MGAILITCLKFLPPNLRKHYIVWSQMTPGKHRFFVFPVERDPQKRKVKPVQNPLLDFDLGESSDDSDFRIEDHNDSGDDSINSNDEESGNYLPKKLSRMYD